MKYFIRPMCKDDYLQVAEVYNSNGRFLAEHLGMERVDERFVAKESLKMKRVGFTSCVIEAGEDCRVRGILEYRPGKEAYLSLLMLASDLHGRGMGRDIYARFEARLLPAGCETVRIDVVRDYPGNAAPFWQKLGFVECETVKLEWGEKHSDAVVMRKTL